MAGYIDYGIEVPEGQSSKYSTICPICSSHRKKKNDKCLTVYFDEGNEGKFHCHHCGSYGYKDSGWWYTNPDYGGSGESSMARAMTLRKSGGDGSSSEKKNYNTPPVLPAPDESEELYKKTYEFFKARGISWDVVKKNGIRWQKEKMPKANWSPVGTILFPYFENGNLVNIKYRGPKKDFKQVSNAKKTVFGYDDIKGQENVVICEGEVDKLTFNEAGFWNVCSVPDGAPDPKSKAYRSKFDFLAAIEGIIKNTKRVFIASDSDDPGKVLEEELARRIGRAKCFRVVYPEDCKDANDVLVNHGVDAVKGLLSSAIPFPIEGVYSIKDFHKSTKELFKTGFVPGTPVGLPDLDKKITFKEGHVTCLTGIPGSGKSAFVRYCAVSLAKQGWRFLVFDWENTPPDRFIAAMSQPVVGKPFDYKFNGAMSEEEFEAAEAWLDDRFDLIYDENYNLPDLDEILDKARSSVFRKGINALIVDAWNNVRHSRGGAAVDEYMNEQLKKVVGFARSTGIHVFIVAHPKSIGVDRNGEFKKPTSYDINGGAAWFNSMDNIIVLHRFASKEKNCVDVFVDKIKFEEIGETGRIDLYYNKPTGRYFNNRESLDADLTARLGSVRSDAEAVYSDDEAPF